MTFPLETLHPRPQLARPGWIDLCGEWRFAYDDADIGLKEHWQSSHVHFDRTIDVPFPPESPASGIGDPSFHPIVWYARTVHLASPGDGRRAILHFGAIDYQSLVWVNGALLASHRGGQTPFEVDITAALVPDSAQFIAVRAKDQPDDLAQPRGKQDWQETPHDIWYQRTTGIWQPAWLEVVDQLHITGLQWTPHFEQCSLGLSIDFSEAPLNETNLRVLLTVEGSRLLAETWALTDASLTHECALDLAATGVTREDLAWSPDHPRLIEATLTLLCDGEPTDEVWSYAGLRSVGVGAGRFLLNGAPIYLRWALAQGYWPESHLAAPSEQALRREVEIAKELGFNGLRIHQKIDDPRFLYWCDRLGLMVSSEAPNAYIFSLEAVERLTMEWMERVRRDYSHPCVVAWIPFNESWGVPDLATDPAQQAFVQALYHLTRTLDPTRPIIANDGWEYICGDLFGIHDYSFDSAVIRERYGTQESLGHTIRAGQPGAHVLDLGGIGPGDAPVLLSEFGGISFRPNPGEPWFGYGTVTNAEAYLEKFRELIEATLSCSPLAGFCYTQLTDTAQETNGLVTAQREYKLNPDAVRRITTWSPQHLPSPKAEH